MSGAELMGLSTQQLREAVSRLSSTANKRMKRIEKSGLFSPAVKEAGGKFGTRGKDYNALLSEYMRVRSFIKNPTSSIVETQKLNESMLKTAKDVYGFNVSQEEFDKIVNEYYKLSKYDNEYQAQKLRYGFLYSESMTEEEKNIEKDLAKKLIELLNRYTSPGGIGYEGVADFFELE